MSSASNAAFRLLPAIDEALRTAAIQPWIERSGRAAVRDALQAVVDGWRDDIRAGALGAADLEECLAQGGLESALASRLAADEASGVRPAINATGVVLHTGLGRAPIHPEVAERMRAVAEGYCVLEIETSTGERGRRDAELASLCRKLLGCEEAIAVNNNAGAAFLMVHGFAAGKETIVSRGELVEIGGSFRVPKILEAANSRLVEVGTTNRTRIADYEAGIGDDTGLLMKVHTSNFKVVGFTEEVPMSELAELGARRGVPTAFDLGSGRVEFEGAAPLDGVGGETLVRQAVESGLDVVGFSGDKLLGGPQAGILVGKKEAVLRLRRSPLYRALRCDKVTLAGLEATLRLLLAGRGDEIPARRMLLATPEEMRARAEALASLLAGVPSFQAELIDGESEPGSGSAPGVYLPTCVVRLQHERLSPDQLATSLRACEPPVFTRIAGGAVLLDPRGLLPGDEERLAAACASLADAG